MELPASHIDAAINPRGTRAGGEEKREAGQDCAGSWAACSGAHRRMVHAAGSDVQRVSGYLLARLFEANTGAKTPSSIDTMSATTPAAAWLNHPKTPSGEAGIAAAHTA